MTKEKKYEMYDLMTMIVGELKEKIPDDASGNSILEELLRKQDYETICLIHKLCAASFNAGIIYEVDK